MTKKVYLQPAIEVNELDLNAQILAGSVQTSGLGNSSLTEDETPGDTWGDAMSRGSGSVWDEGECW